MYCHPPMSTSAWRWDQERIEARADYAMDRERIRNGELRYLPRFIKRAVRWAVLQLLK